MKEIKINNNIEEDHVPLYSPEGSLIGIIENGLAFNDVRIQIIENKLSGYYIMYKGQKCLIGTNGELETWPNDLYTTYTDQLLKMIRS